MRKGCKYIKLGEIGKINSGKSIPSDEIKSNAAFGLYPCYGGNGIRGYVQTCSYNGVFPIIGRVGALCGNIHLADGKFYATEHALVMKISNDCSPRFIVYLLRSLNLNKYAKGVAQPVISASTLSNIDVCIPPVEEQERIAAELDLLAGVIDKQKSQLCELDNLAQSIFYDMFGDPETNEKKWTVKKLRDVSLSKLTYGSGASAVEYDGSVRYIRITDIKDDGELNSDMVSPSVCADKYILNDGDVLFARTGATVGKSYRHYSKYGKCLFAGYLIRLIPNREVVLPDYIYGVTKTLYYKHFVSCAQKAVAQPNINAEQYGNLSICVPPLYLQQKYTNQIKLIEMQKASIKKSINETQKLFDYTMDKYFG